MLQWAVLFSESAPAPDDISQEAAILTMKKRAELAEGGWQSSD